MLFPSQTLSRSSSTDVLELMKKRNRETQKLISFLLVLSLISLGASTYFKGILPLPNEILPSLVEEPIQENEQGEEFSFAYRGTEYFAKPIAEYELSGLVVSHNNIHSIMDMYHNKNSVDTKDLCVVWGENVKNGSYLDTKIENHSWTCFFQYGSGVPFHPFQLSNNHLITSDDAIREKIKDVHVGDQITFRGKLVDYGEASGRYYRISSDSRTDTNSTARGGGACEVVFVEDITVLKAANPEWNRAYEASLKAVLGLIALKIFVLITGAYRRKRFSDMILSKRDGK